MQLHAKWAASGENLIIRSNDLYLFSRALREEIHQMKSILGDDSSMQSAPQPLVI